MMFWYKVLQISMFTSMLMVSSCSAHDSHHNEVINFGELLRPYYEDSPISETCNVGAIEKVDIPVFDNFRMSFDYRPCQENSKNTNFRYVKDHLGFGPYIVSDLTIVTPASVMKENPDADPEVKIPFATLKAIYIGDVKAETYIKNRPSFHPLDWDICKVRKVHDHIWVLDNTEYQEVPTLDLKAITENGPEYWVGDQQMSRSEYRKTFGAQMLKNRACGNDQDYYWHVIMDGVFLLLYAPHISEGTILPSSIVFYRQ